MYVSCIPRAMKPGKHEQPTDQPQTSSHCQQMHMLKGTQNHISYTQSIYHRVGRLYK